MVDWHITLVLGIHVYWNANKVSTYIIVFINQHTLSPKIAEIAFSRTYKVLTDFLGEHVPRLSIIALNSKTFLHIQPSQQRCFKNFLHLQGRIHIECMHSGAYGGILSYRIKQNTVHPKYFNTNCMCLMTCK